jgi:hypothetical protein
MQTNITGEPVSRKMASLAGTLVKWGFLALIVFVIAMAVYRKFAG